MPWLSSSDTNYPLHGITLKNNHSKRINISCSALLMMWIERRGGKEREHLWIKYLMIFLCVFRDKCMAGKKLGHIFPASHRALYEIANSLLPSLEYRHFTTTPKIKFNTFFFSTEISISVNNLKKKNLLKRLFQPKTLRYNRMKYWDIDAHKGWEPICSKSG